jgi:hypothetical protein
MEAVVKNYIILNLIQIKKLIERTTKFYKHDLIQTGESDPTLKFQKLVLLMDNLFYKFQLTDLVQLLFLKYYKN